MLFGHLVIGNLQLVIGNRQLAMNKLLLKEGNGKKTIGNIIGKTKVSVLFLDRVEFLDRLERLDRLESPNRLDCLVRIE